MKRLILCFMIMCNLSYGSNLEEYWKSYNIGYDFKNIDVLEIKKYCISNYKNSDELSKICTMGGISAKHKLTKWTYKEFSKIYTGS